jgi:GNAT superfamily N-acetyltransferase
MPASTKAKQKLKVRRVAERDYAELLRLIAAFAKSVRRKPPDMHARRRLIQDISSRGRIHVYVATVGKRLVGYALYFYTYSSFLGKPNLYIDDLFVLPEYRKKGVGSMLFKRCTQEARRNKCAAMHWTTLTWLKEAIRFYRNLDAERQEDSYHYRLTLDS